MQRRSFLKLTSGAALGATAGSLPALGRRRDESEPAPPPDQTSFFVSVHGDDRNPGTESQPFATLGRAQRAVRLASRDAPVYVRIGEGTHYLGSTLRFEPQDSGTPHAPVTWAAAAGATVTLSGGQRLTGSWSLHGPSVMKTPVPEGLDFTQLFVNGRRQIRARFPNYDPADPGRSGYLTATGAVAKDTKNPFAEPNEDMTFSGEASRGVCYDPATFTTKTWSNPRGAQIHIFQQAYWGNLQWEIQGIDSSSHTIWFGAGGQQISAKWDRHSARVGEGSRFFIDNVFEELDAPGEWFLHTRSHTLYYYPASDLDLRTALVEVPLHASVIQFAGSQESPVHDIIVRGVRLARTASTYMDRYDVPSLSDWSIHRGGTVLAEKTWRCSIENCWFDANGGNGIFVNNYNREFAVSGCKFTETGDSAICFVGDLEQTNGMQRAFPYECRATNNLMHDCGFYGKQIAAVYISRAKRITISHNTVYNMPRAAFCIGDSTWGGHIVEFNETHDTVREPSDHGSLNAWGRDRAWALAQSHAPYTADRSIDAWDMLVDAMEPVIVRNNFFNEKSGWGYDLDDGASNYKIYNNISVGGVSFKWREGAYREVYNNIWYKSRAAPCFHVGNNDNHDRYYYNITVMDPGETLWPDGWPWWPQMFHSIIAPPAEGPWFAQIDHNLFWSEHGEFQAVVDQLRSEDGKRNPRRYDLAAWQALGWDKNSAFADPQFVDPENQDFRVRPGSPALKLGFTNFEMGGWGITGDFPKQWLSDIGGDPPPKRSKA